MSEESLVIRQLRKEPFEIRTVKLQGLRNVGGSTVDVRIQPTSPGNGYPISLMLCDADAEDLFKIELDDCLEPTILPEVIFSSTVFSQILLVWSSMADLGGDLFSVICASAGVLEIELEPFGREVRFTLTVGELVSQAVRPLTLVERYYVPIDPLGAG